MKSTSRHQRLVWSVKHCQAFAGRLAGAIFFVAAAIAQANPVGYVQRIIPLNAPPVALAFDQQGLLYALEEAGFGNNTATMRVFAADRTPLASFSVQGEDPNNFFVGDMTYDPLGDRLLITDNTTTGRIYAVGKTGGQVTIAANFPTVSGIAVRMTGEIVISTAVGFGNGGVYEINRATGAKTQKMLGLDYGAGLVFHGSDLIVQDAASMTPYPGRLQRVPVAPSPGGLAFGAAQPILAGMSSAYGVAFDSDGDLFTTGRGGVFNVGETPAVESQFYNNGRSTQNATAIAFFGGAAPFEPFTGPAGGVLAVTADGSDVDQDLFVTVFTPAAPQDFNADGAVDGLDLGVWRSNFGNASALRQQGDADGDHDVDGDDLLLWQRAVTFAPLATVVPEPASLTTCASAMVVLFVFRSRNHNFRRSAS